MKTVLVLIVLLLAGIAGLLYIKLSQETVTWDMDPTRMIVPLDKPAEYAAAGMYDRALIDISYRIEDVVGRAEKADIDLNDPDWFLNADPDTAQLILINMTILVFADCWIRATMPNATGSLATCVSSESALTTPRFTSGANDLAKAFIMEANGANAAALLDIYVDAGRDLAVAIAGGQNTHDIPERRAVAAHALDFATARAARLYLMDGNLDLPLLPENVGNTWCRADRDETCPGALATYRAIKLYLEGRHRDARTTALVALEGNQPWVYRSPYEHPLLWILAASQQQGIDHDIGDLQPLIDAALIEWPEDARLALEVLTGEMDAVDPGDPLWVACTTPGCHYFLAEYFAAAGDQARVEAMRSAGLDLCKAARSITCTALRFAGAEAAMAVSP